jgi:hypothetical protein
VESESSRLEGQLSGKQLSPTTFLRSYEAAVKHYEAAIQGSKKMQGVASDWAVTYNNLGHAYRRLE